MSIARIACVASGSQAAQQGLEALERRYSLVPVEQASVIVALGGDGFMLDCLHRYLNTAIPIYGMNRGTVGFLMNSYREQGLIERIDAAEPQQLYPLLATVTDVHGRHHEAIAFNEVAMVRYSQQSANLRIAVNGQVRLEKMICDGVLVCTPAGSTAYNLSVHGPVIPIGSDILGLTPISPFRPRRWRGALLPRTAVVEITNLDPGKRPLGVSADSVEVRDAVKITIRADDSRPVNVLFDHGHSLEERIIHEQFIN
jgi:NAD+ kinase